MATHDRDVRNADARERESARSASMKPEAQNEDGTVRDVAAQRFLARQRAQASTAPADRIAEDQAVGTPAWLDENTDKNLLSDGGPTLVNTKELGKSVLDAAESELDSDEGYESQKRNLVTPKDDDKSTNRNQTTDSAENASPAVTKNNTK